MDKQKALVPPLLLYLVRRSRGTPTRVGEGALRVCLLLVARGVPAGTGASSLGLGLLAERVVDRVLVEQDRRPATAVLVVLEAHGHEPLGHALRATLGLRREEQVGVLAVLLVGRAELEADEVLRQLDVTQGRPLVRVEEYVAVEVAAHRHQPRLALLAGRGTLSASALLGGLVVGDQLLPQEAERVGVDRAEEGRERGGRGVLLGGEQGRGGS
jgi:hypothetical protein